MEYTIDAVSAILAAGMYEQIYIHNTRVAPIVSLVDKSVIAHASGRQKLEEGLKEGLKSLIREPHKFVQQRFPYAGLID
jgi:hypothetical protein